MRNRAMMWLYVAVMLSLSTMLVLSGSIIAAVFQFIAFSVAFVISAMITEYEAEPLTLSLLALIGIALAGLLVYFAYAQNREMVAQISIFISTLAGIQAFLNAYASGFLGLIPQKRKKAKFI